MLFPCGNIHTETSPRRSPNPVSRYTELRMPSRSAAILLSALLATTALAKSPFPDPSASSNQGPLMQNPGGALPDPKSAAVADARSLDLADICTLTAVEKRLDLRVNLKLHKDNNQFIAKVAGIDKDAGYANVTCNWLPFGPRIGDINYFGLTYARSDAKSPTLTIYLCRGTLQVTHVTPVDDAVSIALVQGVADPDDPNRAAFKPHVKLTASQGRSELTSIDADNFFLLRQQKPKEFRKSAWPLLNALGAPDLCYPRLPEAAQILADQPILKPDEIADIQKIVTALDADDPDARDSASQRLSAMGWRALLVVVELNQKSLSAEQQWRIKAFLQEQQLLAPEDLPKRRADLDTLIDCLGVTDTVLGSAAHARLEKLSGQKIDWSPTAPLATRRVLAEKVRTTLAK